MLQTDDDYVNTVFLFCYESVTILISSSLAGALTPGACSYRRISYQHSADINVETAHNPVVASISACSPLPLHTPIWYEKYEISQDPFFNRQPPSEPNFLFFSPYQSAFVASFR